jgi:N-acetylglucosaminyldiphosphoundecaprenol N-acetyl-beta-D-mannosaminyltransferase
MIGGSNDWHARWSRIVGSIRVVSSPPDERALLDELASGKTVRTLGFVNAYAMNSIVENVEFFNALTNADILLRDGSGMAVLYRRCRRESGLNMNGSDFIPKILAAFHGRRVAVWGTKEPCVGAAVARCEAEFGVQVISRENGFHEVDFYRRLADVTQPDLILLGMGMPKQEHVAQTIRLNAVAPSLIICGGAIIDFLGGKVSRSPKWMRVLGIEWMYRFAREPHRLFRRYVIGNPLFLYRVRTWQTHISRC